MIVLSCIAHSPSSRRDPRRPDTLWIFHLFGYWGVLTDKLYIVGNVIYSASYRWQTGCSLWRLPVTSPLGGVLMTVASFHIRHTVLNSKDKKHVITDLFFICFATQWWAVSNNAFPVRKKMIRFHRPDFTPRPPNKFEQQLYSDLKPLGALPGSNSYLFQYSVKKKANSLNPPHFLYVGDYVHSKTAKCGL